jgi:SAM-dependent methyltransferase
MEFYQNKKIAEDFSRTRYKVWDGVKNFIDSIPTDYLILDAGCGNGKNMLCSEHKFIGIDTSRELLDIVREKTRGKNNILNIVESSIITIPFADHYFDDVICIAVIHHINDMNLRFKAFEELIRVCKHGGKILITVWMVDGNKYYNNSFLHPNNISGDRLVPWKLDGNVSNRFYHFYTNDEIVNVCEQLKIKYHLNYEIKVEMFNYYVTLTL